jgi:hypothetical protein
VGPTSIIFTPLTPELNSWCNIQNPEYLLQISFFQANPYKTTKKSHKKGRG